MKPQDCLSKHHDKISIVLAKCDLLPIVRDSKAGHVNVIQNSRQLIANQVLFMVSKFFTSYKPVKFYNVSTERRPLPEDCDVEAIDISHENLYKDFLLMRRSRCSNIVNTLQERLKRCQALTIVLKEFLSKLGHFGKARKKQEILDDFPKFLREVDTKSKAELEGVVEKHVNKSELKRNLHKFDIANLPKVSTNQILTTLEELLEEVLRIIPRNFFEVELKIPSQFKDIKSEARSKALEDY